MAIIWRLEINNNGVFSDDSPLLDMCTRFNNVSKYPTPAMEGLVISCDRMTRVCGCADIPQLRHWFGAKYVVKALDKVNAQILKLEVPDHLVTEGKKQVIFNKRKAKLIKTFPISSIHELENLDKELSCNTMT